jgi:hypothetical protein
MSILKLQFVSATKGQKVSQKKDTPQTPYVLIGKDNASETAIMMSLKGGAREIVQGDKKSLFIHFGLTADARYFGIQVLKDKKEAESLKSKGLQIRELKTQKNLNGGYGCTSLKKSAKNVNGLDFADMTTSYIGNLERVNPEKVDTNYHFIALLKKVE